MAGGNIRIGGVMPDIHKRDFRLPKAPIDKLKILLYIQTRGTVEDALHFGKNALEEVASQPKARLL
jgi:hypothetical protein